MPIALSCAGCGRKYKAPDRAAGRVVPCQNCGASIAVPAAPVEDPAAYLLKDDQSSAATPEPVAPEPPSTPPTRPRPTPPPPRPRPGPNVSNLPPLTANEPPLWLR